MAEFKEDPRKVLVLDDEPDIVEAMSELIQDLGYKVIATTSANHAIDICAEQAFDTILSDINMPEMSGFDFLSKIRSKQVDTPVVFITAAGAEKKNTTSAIRLGAFDYIEKPWTTDEMQEMLSMATEYGMRLRRLNHIVSMPDSEKTANDLKQLELDKKFLALGPIVYNQRRNNQ